jgi:hypothetical protein
MNNAHSSHAESVRNLLDPYIYHEDSDRHTNEIKQLYDRYKYELSEIISLYHFKDEIDLFCRCETMNASGGGGSAASKRNALEDSATVEVENLVKNIRSDFYSEFEQKRLSSPCCTPYTDQRTGHTRYQDCKECYDGKLAKATCAYIYTYKKAHSLPLTSNRRILSFPWLFAEHLSLITDRNRRSTDIQQIHAVFGPTFSDYVQDIRPTFKVFVSDYMDENTNVEFYYRNVEEKRTSLLPMKGNNERTIPNVKLLMACFVEVLHNWLHKQAIFGDECIETDVKPLVPEYIWHELLVQFLSGEYRSNVRLCLILNNSNEFDTRYCEKLRNCHRQWTHVECTELHGMFMTLDSYLIEHTNRTKLMIWAYLHEYILLALQSIAVKKCLVKNWLGSNS